MGILFVMELSTIKTLLIDGDGVLWQDEKPMARLDAFFDALRERGIQWALLSNNAAPTIEDYVAKLRGFGIQAERGNIITSATVTAAYLIEKHPAGSALYVIGQSGLKQALTEAGFNVSDGGDRPSQVAAVIVGIDRQFTYDKLKVATQLIRAGAPFIATNTDSTFPTPEGLIPGAGSIVAAIKIATDQSPIIMGKPEPPMFRVALKHFDAHAATTAMLGDRLETDIAGAQPLGLGTLLVLSGVSHKEDIATSGITPDLIFEDIGQIADALHAL